MIGDTKGTLRDFLVDDDLQSSKVISDKHVSRSEIMEEVENISGQTSDAAKVIEVIVLCLIIIAAVVGNISIWIIIINSKALRTITNMFILGLSAADLLVSIANMPMTVYAVISGSWPLSDAACVIFGYINMLTLVTSVLSLCNISINRYFMVCKPSKFQGIYTKRNAVFMIFGVVSLSALLSSPPLFGWGEYAYIPIQSFCFCDWANHMWYAFFMIGCCFGGPFGVMTVCNIFIYRRVRASRRAVSIRVPEPSSVVNSTCNDKDKDKTKDKRDVSDEFDSPDNENEVEEIGKAVTTQVEELGVKTVSKDVHEDDGCCTIIQNNLLHPMWAVRTRKESMFRTVKHRSDASSDYEFSDNNSSGQNDDNANRISNTSSTSAKVLRRSATAKARRREEYRFAITLIVVVIVFVICWLPYCISMLVSIFCKDPVPRAFHMFTLVIGYANSCCNPIIYGLMNKRFAAGFKDLYCCCRKSSFRMPIQASP